MMKWYQTPGNGHDVVISSRVRLARNLEEFPFSSKLDNELSSQVVETVRNALSKLGNPLEETNINSIPVKKQILVEDHIISPDFCKENALEKVLFTDNNGNIAIMVNEEDHIRIQSIYPGFDLDKAYETASLADDCISANAKIAFDEGLGYLTACPTNLGTGLRASVMLHLPAMCAYGYIKHLSSLMTKIGLTVRGIYGEGSEGTACMYQLSNQVTLGISEEDAIEKLKNAVNQIIAKEREMRNNLTSKDDYELADRLWRSYGTLKYARRLDTAEASRLISNVRLGAVCGIIPELANINLTELLFEIMPSHISDKFSDANSASSDSASKRDVYRASYIREKLSELAP